MLKEILKEALQHDCMTSMDAKLQLLYVHCLLNADEEGYVNNYDFLKRGLNCFVDDSELFEYKFLIEEENGFKLDETGLEIIKAIAKC